MAYVHKTKSFFRILYTVVFGLAVILWMFTLGTFGRSGDGRVGISQNRALADVPSSGGWSCGGGCIPGPESGCSDGGSCSGGDGVSCDGGCGNCGDPDAGGFGGSACGGTCGFGNDHGGTGL